MKRSLIAARLATALIATSLAVELRAAQLPSNAMVISPTAASDYAAPVLAGISNQGRNRRQPYATAGDRAYLIGTQDGNFPDMGRHIPGEMGGLWLPPIKLIDGFQARIAEAGASKEILLSESTEMIAYPYGNRFRYGRVLHDLDVERLQFSPDHRCDHPVSLQERLGPSATIALSVVRQNRSAPRMESGPRRDTRWPGRHRLAS
jgi:hypothetical protein